MHSGAGAPPLHDIGKVGIVDAILRKPGPLNDEELKIMREHTVIGGDTLHSVIDPFDDHTFLEMAMEIAYCHHERRDGSGYPKGLTGEEIPLDFDEIRRSYRREPDAEPDATPSAGGGVVPFRPRG